MKTTILKRLASNLKKLRKKYNLTQSNFAKKCGLHRTYVASLELGKRNISLLNLYKISKAFNISISNLLGEK